MFSFPGIRATVSHILFAYTNPKYIQLRGMTGAHFINYNLNRCVINQTSHMFSFSVAVQSPSLKKSFTAHPHPCVNASVRMVICWSGLSILLTAVSQQSPTTEAPL